MAVTRHALLVSAFGRKSLVTFGVISVSAEGHILLAALLSVLVETKIPAFGRPLETSGLSLMLQRIRGFFFKMICAI